MRKHSSERRQISLSHLSWHLFKNRDRQRLWQLLRDEAKRRDQIQHFGHYQESYRALELGLRFYAEQDGRESEDDPRLCWLAVRSSRLTEEAATDYAGTIERVESQPFEDPQRIPLALQRFAGFSQDELLPALLLVLWIETDRARELPPERRDQGALWEVLTALEERLPGSTVDWSQQLTPELIAWLGKRLVDVFATDASNRQRLESAFFRPLIRMLDGITESGGRPARVALARELARHRIFDLAQEVAFAIADEWDRSRALEKVAERLMETGEEKLALKLCDRFPHFSDQNQLRFALALRFQSLRDYEEANAVAEKIEDSELQARLLTDRALGLARQGLLQEAHEHFARALAAAPRPYEDLEDQLDVNWILPGRIGAILRLAWDAGVRDPGLWEELPLESGERKDNQTLYVVVAFLAEIEHVDRAMNLFTAMTPRESWWPEAAVEIAKCLAGQKRSKEARTILAKALEAAQGDGGTLRRVQSLATVAGGLVTNGELVPGASIFNQAIAVLDRRKTGYEQARAARTLFAQLGGKEYFPERASLLREALSALRNMDATWWRAKVLPAASHAILCSEVGEGFRRRELLDELLEIAADSSESSTADFSYTVIRDLVDARYLDEAERFAEQVSEVCTGAFFQLARSLASSGDRQRALTAFQKAFGEETRSVGLLRRNDGLIELLSDMARTGFYVEALALSRTLPSRLDRLAASAVLPEIVRGHGSGRARRLFQQSLTLSVQGPAVDFRALAAIATELVRLDAPPTAIRMLRQGLSGAGALVDELAIEEALDCSIRALQAIPDSTSGKDGLIDLTFQIATGLEVRKGSALCALVRFLVESGVPERATAIADHVEASFDRADALGLAARGWFGHGDPYRGRECFREALAAVRGQVLEVNPAQALVVKHLLALPPFPERNDLLCTALDDSAQLKLDSDKAEALTRVTREILDAEDVVEVREVLEHAQRLIEKTEMREHLVEIQADMCGAIARSGQLDDALARAQKLATNKEAHARAMTSIVLALGKRGEILEAQRLLSEVVDEWRRAHAAGLLGEMLAEMPRSAQAAGDVFGRLFTIVGAIGDTEKRLEILVNLARSANRLDALSGFRAFLKGFLLSIDGGVEKCRAKFDNNPFLQHVVELWTLLGDFRQALEVIEQQALDRERTGVYRALADRLLDVTEDPRLPELLPRIEEGVRSMDYLDFRVSALTNIALVHGRLGNAEDSLRLAEVALATIREIESSWDRRIALSATSKKIRALEQHLDSFPWTFFVDAVATLETSRDQEEILTELAPIAAALDVHQETLTAIEGGRIANSARQAFVVAWQAALAGRRESARSLLRRSLTLFPFEAGLGARSVQIYLEHCLRCGELEDFFAILRECSDLDFLALSD